MESAEQQELRARQHFNPAAATKAGLGVGLILFFMSGGSPWSTAQTMNMMMGRDVPVGFWGLVFGHFAIALIYSFVIGALIYRLPTVLAVPAGIVVAIALYALNELIFRSGGFTMTSPVFVTMFVHVIFGLFVSLLYKALSVPPPLP